MISQADEAREFDAGVRNFADGNAGEARSLLSLGSNSLDNLEDLHQCIVGLVGGVIRTNLRLARELLHVESPRAFIELQQRFIREYFEAFQLGAAALLRATRRTEAAPG